MKITSVETIPLLIPLDVPYGEITSVPAVVARVQTDHGIEGLGHAITLSTRNFRSLATAVDELAEVLIGEDPRGPERIHRKMMPDGRVQGGVGNMATAALDVAVWDLAGKAAGLPLYRLLGGMRDRIPCYASLRLGRTLPTSQLHGIASSLVDQGFRAVKMNLGGQPTVADEVARVEAVRDAIGPKTRLLADANFRYTPSQAIRVGRAIEAFDLFWLEDPVPSHNLQDLADVRSALETPIAAGEAYYGLPSFRDMFEARAVDMPMPDLVRLGGITPYFKAAHLAEAFGLPLACHLLPEISAQVVAAVPNGLIVEFVPWAWQLFDNCPQLENGDLVLSERPGTGLTLKADFLQQHRIK